MWLAILFPCSLAMRALVRIGTNSALRRGKLETVRCSTFPQALLQPAVLLFLASTSHDGALSLAIAEIAGYGGAAVYLCWKERDFLAQPFRQSWSKSPLVLIARKWSVLPLFNLPGALLSIAFVSSPLLIMPIVADAIFAGKVALAMRLFDVMTQIISGAGTPVLIDRLRPSSTNSARLFGRVIMTGMFMTVVATYLAAVLGVVVLTPLLKDTVFGGLLEVVLYVAAFHACNALAGPLIEVCGLYREQSALTLIQCLALIGSGFALILGLLVSPAAGLAFLVLTALVRVVLIGEQLRTLSLRSLTPPGRSSLAGAQVARDTESQPVMGPGGELGRSGSG
jgi:hypothetical protein